VTAGDAEASQAGEWDGTDRIEQDLTGADLGGAVFEAVTFERCRLRGADLTDAVTRGCRFVSCDLAGADLSGSTHHGSAFTNTRFVGARLSTATFDGCKMTGSDLTEATLLGVAIIGGDWSYVNLRGADLRDPGSAGPAARARRSLRGRPHGSGSARRGPDRRGAASDRAGGRPAQRRAARRGGAA